MIKSFFFIWLSVCSYSKADSDFSIGITQEYDSLHPQIMSMAASRYLQYALNRTLLTLDSKGKWVPMLAKEIPTKANRQLSTTLEEGKKKNVAIWVIREQAKWSDGQAITCNDFSYSLEVGKHPLSQVSNKEVYDKIERIESDSKNPKKCRFVYSDAKWNYFQIPEFFPLPAHLDKKIFDVVKNEKGAYSDKNIYTIKNIQAAVFSGPYRVVEATPGSHVTLARNEHFFGKVPYFKKIIFRVIPNLSSLEANLKSGNIDMVVPIGFSFDMALDFEKRWATESKSKHKVVFTEGANFEHLTFNLEHPILKDVKVREALILSVNRDELSKVFFDGKQAVAHFYLSKICPWFPKDLKKVKTYRFSMKEAETILSRLGWEKKSDGFRYKEDKKLAFDLVTTSGNSIRQNVQVYLKEKWKKLGVDVQIKNYPARVLFGEIAKKRQYDGAIIHAWSVAPESLPYNQLASKSIPSEANNWSGFNFGGWNSEKFNELMTKIEMSESAEARKSYVIKMLNIYNEELSDIPLFYRTEVAVIPKRLNNYHINPHPYYETNQIETWSF